MSRGIKKTGSLTEKAILYALIGGAALLSPMGGKIVISIAGYYLKKWWEEGGPYVPPEKDPEQVRQSIYRLKKNSYIKWKYYKNKKSIRLELTKKGKKFFEKVQLEDVSVPIQKDWDGNWRFVLFDIPEKSRFARNILRDKLKHMDFFQFQKSVWIHPFECEKEIKFVCEFLGVNAHTMVFVSKIDNDKILRRHFYTKGILEKRYLDIRYQYFGS